MGKKIKYGIFSEIELFDDSILLRNGAYHKFTLNQLEAINIEEYNNGKKGFIYFKFVEDEKTHHFLFTNSQTKEDTYQLYDYLLPYTKRLIIDKDNKTIKIYPKSKINNSLIHLNFDQIKNYELVKATKKYYTYQRTEDVIGSDRLGQKNISAMLTFNSYEPLVELKIKLDLYSYDEPYIYISYYQKYDQYDGISTNSIFEQCQKDISVLESICESNSKNALLNNTSIQSNYSVIPLEELKKLHELLQTGIITQEEFDAKKKQLLGL